MQSAKEKISNVAADAKAGMEKTKASAQEKVDKMTAHDPMQKEMAMEKKETRIQEAELDKQQAHHHNTAERAARTTPGTTTVPTIGTTTSHTTTTGHTGTTGGTFGDRGY